MFQSVPVSTRIFRSLESFRGLSHHCTRATVRFGCLLLLAATRVITFIFVLDSESASKQPLTGRVFASEAAPYGFIRHLDFLIFTLLSRPYFLDFASSMALTAAPLSGSTVMSTQLISTVFRGYCLTFPRCSPLAACSWTLHYCCQTMCQLNLVLICGRCILFPYENRSGRQHCSSQSLPPECLRSWLDFNLAGMPAVELCDGSSCRRRMFSFVREVSQVVLEATSQTHRRHMITRIFNLDLPFSIMAINISVSNQPATKSQCSPSALRLAMKESQVSSLPCLVQHN